MQQGGAKVAEALMFLYFCARFALSGDAAPRSYLKCTHATRLYVHTVDIIFYIFHSAHDI